MSSSSIESTTFLSTDLPRLFPLVQRLRLLQEALPGLPDDFFAHILLNYPNDGRNPIRAQVEVEVSAAQPDEPYKRVLREIGIESASGADASTALIEWTEALRLAPAPDQDTKAGRERGWKQMAKSFNRARKLYGPLSDRQLFHLCYYDTGFQAEDDEWEAENSTLSPLEMKRMAGVIRWSLGAHLGIVYVGDAARMPNHLPPVAVDQGALRSKVNTSQGGAMSDVYLHSPIDLIHARWLCARFQTEFLAQGIGALPFNPVARRPGNWDTAHNFLKEDKRIAYDALREAAKELGMEVEEAQEAIKLVPLAWTQFGQSDADLPGIQLMHIVLRYVLLHSERAYGPLQSVWDNLRFFLDPMGNNEQGIKLPQKVRKQLQQLSQDKSTTPQDVSRVDTRFSYHVLTETYIFGKETVKTVAQHLQREREMQDEAAKREDELVEQEGDNGEQEYEESDDAINNDGQNDGDM